MKVTVIAFLSLTLVSACYQICREPRRYLSLQERLHFV